MSQGKQVSSRKRKSKAVPGIGAGLLAIATGASAEVLVDTPRPNLELSQQVFLGEEEIADVSLATFHVFDKESGGSLKPGVLLVRGGGGGCGCGHGCDDSTDRGEGCAIIICPQTQARATGMKQQRRTPSGSPIM